MEMIVCLEKAPGTEPWAWNFPEFNEWFNNLNICGDVSVPLLLLTAMVLYSSFIDNVVLGTLVWSPPIHGYAFLWSAWLSTACAEFQTMFFFMEHWEFALSLVKRGDCFCGNRRSWEKMARHDGRGKVSGAAGDTGSRFSSQFSLGLQGSVSFLFPNCFEGKTKTKAILFF